jgi:hypothetical protein
MDLSIISKMSDVVSGINDNKVLVGFERAYQMAQAVEQLRELLTPEYMAPIMKLQGTRLGFKTDRDKNRDGSKGLGYPEAVVKECLIEAVLLGVQPVGNQFNIIAGGCYITKEGFGYLLLNTPDLTWSITPQLPRISSNNTSAAIVMRIEYTHKGKKAIKEIDIPVKINEYSGTDLVIGKAHRKARAWLHTTITGSEAPEGDVMDIDYKEMKSTLKEEPITIEELTALYEQKKDKLPESEWAHAIRIIENKETASYSKLKSKLEKL